MELTINDLKQECKYCYREVDASGLEAFRCTNRAVNMETSWCRPKNANEPCSKCDYCKPTEEMGMTIEDTILCLKGIKQYGSDTFTKRSQGDWQNSLDTAIETMRKYQKIEQIMSDNGYWCNELQLRDIRKVLEDGSN